MLCHMCLHCGLVRQETHMAQLVQLVIAYELVSQQRTVTGYIGRTAPIAAMPPPANVIFDVDVNMSTLSGLPLASQAS